MKHSAVRSRKSPKPPIAWREAEYAALRPSIGDTFDDRVSENIFDFDDERAEVENIVHRMIDDTN